MDIQNSGEAPLRRPLLANGNWTKNGCCTTVQRPCENDVESRSSAHSELTPLLIFSILVANSAALAFGCASGYTSPIESEIVAEFGLSTAEYSLFGSLLTVGGLVGALSGKMIDYIGRRETMGLSDLFCVLGWTMILSSQGAWSLDLGRFFTGVGVGLLMYTNAVYVAEITPVDVRGRAVVAVQLLICSGVSLMYFVGLLVSWRILAVIGMLPCLMQLVGLFFIPASPRYLAKIGQEKECEAVIQRLRGDGVDVSQEAAEIKEYAETLRRMPQVKFLQLLHWKYARALTIGNGLIILGQLCGAIAVVYYAGDIFEAAGASSTIGTMAVGVIQIPPSALGVYLTDKLGRRPTALFSAAGMCCSCVIVGLGFYLTEQDVLLVTSRYMVLSGILGFFTAHALATSIPFVIVSEIYPLDIKASAGCLVLSVHWGVGWIVSYTFSFMMEWSSSDFFWSKTWMCTSHTLCRIVLDISCCKCFCRALHRQTYARDKRKDVRRNSSINHTTSQLIIYIFRVWQ